MKNSKKPLVTIFTIMLILAGCANFSDELSTKSNNQPADSNSTRGTDADTLNKDLAESEKDVTEKGSEGTDINDHNHADTTDTGKSNANTIDESSNNESIKQEDLSSHNPEGSLKEEYLEKLNNTKKEAEELEATDSSTYALKKVENDRWELWDDLLNEIYGVLKDQLPSQEMDQLREEQRNWIKYRDDRALAASQKYKGGTQEHLEYVSVLVNLTEVKCYELVANYMK